MALAAAPVDIDKLGKYPIVLSDALMGKATSDTYTGIRYNHKPEPSSTASANSLHLQPSSESDPESYDLSVTDNSEQYSYHGVRTSGDGQYVLVFDPVKKHFVLHRIDSTFDMNLTSTPWDEDAASLRSQYPQLQSQISSRAEGPPRKPSKTAKDVTNGTSDVKRRKAEKPKKKPPREPTPDEEDSNDGLTIEYPDGPVSGKYQYQSTPIFQRDPSEEVSEEDSDAEHEEHEEERNQDVDLLQLPSPANNNPGGISDEDIELDLEAELEQALKEAGTGADESSESEEE